jgi:2-keto-4-pentenoate hydratase
VPSAAETTDDALTVELAGRLWRAETDRAAIEPITETWPGLTIDDAYAIQSRNVERRQAAGRVIRGRKVGLTSRPMQEFLRVFEPTFGALLDDMFVEDGDEIALNELIQPRVEAEIAFVMGRALVGPGITTSNALTAIAGVLPALEIGDSRIADWRIQLVDTVADNASSGRLVLGGKLTSITDLDLTVIGMVISRNGVLLHTGAGAAVLGNPARCVAWLANKLSSFGATLRRGDVVLSGALHRLVPALPGDVFRAEFGHLGAVTTHFSNTGPVA